MKLHNTRTHKIEELKPLSQEQVTIYTCGPTVYNSAHIGNLSSYIYADTLRRTVALAGYTPKHVMNYTDVDDKTIRTSLEYYPEDESRKALRKFTDTYIEAFLEDMEAIGNDIEQVTFVRATDYIPAMQKLITELYAHKIAYIANDGVYFSIDAYQASGKKYGQLLELTQANTSTERIQNDEYDKDSVHDFALWKLQKENEPAWEFEIDGKNLKGRPGWHIECSAMSAAELGQPFDIHTGGVDLIFPHHENEIAQSTATTEASVMAQFFVHNEHLLVDGKKMSKSLGNFYTLEDINRANFDPLVFRLMVLQSHYRNRSNFTWENLTAANNSLENIRKWSDLRFQNFKSNELAEYNVRVWQNVLENLENDLRVPDALTHIYGAINKADELAPDQESINMLVSNIDDALSLGLLSRQDITDDHKQLIIEREAARQKKDWAKSDILRDELVEHGVGVKDTDHGTIWFRL